MAELTKELIKVKGICERKTFICIVGIEHHVIFETAMDL